MEGSRHEGLYWNMNFAVRKFPAIRALDTPVQGLLALGGSLQEARKDGIAIVVFYRKSVRLFQCVFSPVLSEASLITAF